MDKGGYVGVTSNAWFNFIKEHKITHEVNFWRKSINNFKVLKKNSPFFFLVKNPPGISGEREVLGYGNFDRYEILTVDEAWRKYDVRNGVDDHQLFRKRMVELFEDDVNVMGCIILKDVHFFLAPVLLSQAGIPFQNSIVSGKGISDEEVDEILKRGNNELKESDLIGFTEDDLSFPEGKQRLKKHLVRERDPKVIKLAKERFKQRFGRLFCEVCGFNFENQYGSIGADYIEGHHVKPVSELKDSEETKIEDIKLVCSNCHRMLHRKRPWLSTDELKFILKQ